MKLFEIEWRVSTDTSGVLHTRLYHPLNKRVFTERIKAEHFQTRLAEAALVLNITNDLQTRITEIEIE